MGQLTVDCSKIGKAVRALNVAYRVPHQRRYSLLCAQHDELLTPVFMVICASYACHVPGSAMRKILQGRIDTRAFFQLLKQTTVTNAKWRGDNNDWAMS